MATLSFSRLGSVVTVQYRLHIFVILSEVIVVHNLDVLEYCIYVKTSMPLCENNSGQFQYE